MKQISCFIPYASKEQADKTIRALEAETEVHDVNRVETSLFRTQTIKEIAAQATAEYTLIYTKEKPLRLGYLALQRLIRIAEDTGAGLLYADHYQVRDGEEQKGCCIHCFASLSFYYFGTNERFFAVTFKYSVAGFHLIVVACMPRARGK